MNESKSGLYFSAIVVMFAGLASRSYRTHLPSFIGEYSGDVLWALMLFLVDLLLSDASSRWLLHSQSRSANCTTRYGSMASETRR